MNIATGTMNAGLTLLLLFLIFRPLELAYPRTLRESAAALHVPLVDVGVLGDGAPPAGNEALFIDSLHLSAAGAEEMARRIAATLAP